LLKAVEEVAGQEDLPVAGLAERVVRRLAAPRVVLRRAQEAL
jgi:hypothetical protein